MADPVVYTDAEHENMLTYLDAMHHETRAQTIARLEAALVVAKASPGADLPPLATVTEPVTREVTVDPALTLAPGEQWDATPGASKAAKKAGVEMGPIPGTGPGGTVTEGDVAAHVADNPGAATSKS